MRHTWCLSIALLLAPAFVFAKGEGVGVYLEGLVSDVRADGPKIHFRLSGTVDLIQYRGRQESLIRIQGDRPVEATTRQDDFCFVMIDDASWHPGPCQKGQILATLKRAAAERVPLRLELSRTALRFGTGEGHVTVTDSVTLRVSERKDRSGAAMMMNEIERAEIEAAVGKRMQSFEAAERARDAFALIAHFADVPGFRVFNDGLPLTYADLTGAVRTSFPTLRSIEGGFADLHVAALGSEHALVTGTFKETVTDGDGTAIRSRGAVSWLWRKVDDGWRIVYGQVDHRPEAGS